ncbi:MAG: hypothetical protein MJA83_17700 [Gammaproteobacteria bacterium]|nr:hypothetical protein [Gammaproteobacteria bacterium]
MILIFFTGCVFAQAKPEPPSFHVLRQALLDAGVSKTAVFSVQEKQFSPDVITAEEYAGKKLVNSLWKDVNGDGELEYAAVMSGYHDIARIGGSQQRRLMVVIFSRCDAGWCVLHMRTSSFKKPVSGVFLEERPNAVRVHIFRGRSQCGSKKPAFYDLYWSDKVKEIVSGLESDDLDPYETGTECR